MAKTVFEPAIPSRPIYGVLKPRDGQFHLLIADGEGATAILDLAKIAPEGFFAKAHIMFISKDTADEQYQKSLEELHPHQIYFGPTFGAAVFRLQRILIDFKMGLQVYLAGTEGLMGQAMREVMNVGVPLDVIQTEHRGSKARRIQCVHCKGITEDVITDPFVCSHCGLNLFVRDHYSRRIAAFQGVRVDAEIPGDVPDQIERFK
jgi:hypothetical protein